MLTIAWHFVSRFSVLVCKATGVWSPISFLMTNIEALPSMKCANANYTSRTLSTNISIKRVKSLLSH